MHFWANEKVRKYLEAKNRRYTRIQKVKQVQNGWLSWGNYQWMVILKTHLKNLTDLGKNVNLACISFKNLKGDSWPNLGPPKTYILSERKSLVTKGSGMICFPISIIQKRKFDL